MAKLSSRLRIREKIGLSLGVVAMIFLGVIWHYHTTLEGALADYQRLQDVYEAKETFALEIERSLLEASRSAKDFFLHREERHVDEVENHVRDMLDQVGRLRAVDEQGERTTREIEALIHILHRDFLAIVV